VTTELKADLVLSGGGVKGIGLSGAAVALLEAGYAIQRVSGTSAGSVVGAILAAGADELTPEQVEQLTMTLPYKKFLDPTHITGIPLLGPAWGVLSETGIYKGDFAHEWIRSELANLGVRTFGDLAIDAPNLPPEQRYRLVVTVSDVTTGQLVRLPWDYHRLYGLDPDEQQVADAVRASMSIPFFFRTAKLTSASGLTSTLVDGGMLSNFPIDSFDRLDGKPPRWPTFGVTLLPNLPQGNDKVIPALAPVNWVFGGPPLIEALITTMIVGRDQAYLNQPWVDSRAIRVDSSKVGFLDFNIGTKQMQELYQNGHDAAKRSCPPGTGNEYLERFRRPGPERLDVEFGCHVVDSGADGGQRIGPGPQLRADMSVLLERREFACGFLGAAEHHVGQRDLVEPAGGHRGLTEERLRQSGCLLVGRLRQSQLHHFQGRVGDRHTDRNLVGLNVVRREPQFGDRRWPAGTRPSRWRGRCRPSPPAWGRTAIDGKARSRP
jgi:NTE family protein